MSALDYLLAPVSAENECGEDISYDPAFQELETLVHGKPETQFSPGEPPNWSEIRGKSLALLERSKHLRVVLTLTAALLRVEGFAGFRDGTMLLKQLIEKYWPTLYPRLDPEDNNDPTERVNIIAMLSAPLGTIGDPLKFLDGLRACPLTGSLQGGRLSMQDIANSRAGVKPAKDRPVPDAAQIDAAFRSTPPETLAAAAAAIAEATAAVQGIDALIDGVAGAAKAKDFSPLKSALAEIQKTVAPYLAATAAETAQAEAGAESAGGEAGGQADGGGLSGSVQNRAQVVQALRMVCDYYVRNEPTSPVPLLMQRAEKLVEQNFLGVVAELSPETLQKMRSLMGITGD